MSMYQLSNHASVVRLTDNAFIPMEASNRDYQAYLEWLAEGNQPLPAPAPAPAPYPQFTALEMLDLFTEEEQLAIATATMSNPAVKLWYDRLIAATFVTYEDPRTEGGLQALVDAGLLTLERKQEIVQKMLPKAQDE